MNKNLLLVVLLISATFTTLTSANPNLNKNPESLKLEKLQSDRIKNQALRRQIAWLLAPIKNKRALNTLVKNNSVLDELSPAAKERFVDSIIFRKNGLGGFNYSDLEAELTPTQIYKILSLFGAQHTVSNFIHARIVSVNDTLIMATPRSALAEKTNDGDIKQKFRVDHKHYRCESRATCGASDMHICMSGC